MVTKIDLLPISDRQVIDFVSEAEDTRGDAHLGNISTYITSKFNRFVQNTTLKRIIGQEKTSIDFENIMNSGKILLVKMGKGRFGPVVCALLANQLVTKFKLAAMQRGDMPSEKRRDFFLYVDEAHNLPVENFMELLSEDRKYRMGLVLATQYAAQLSGKLHGQDLLSAVMGNVGTLLFFRVGRQDAPVLAPMLQPRLNGLDLVNLPDWQGYTKLQLGRSNVQPFSFATEKDESPWNEFLAMRNLDLSRKRYGRPADEVDEEIAARRARTMDFLD